MDFIKIWRSAKNDGQKWTGIGWVGVLLWSFVQLLYERALDGLGAFEWVDGFMSFVSAIVFDRATLLLLTGFTLVFFGRPVFAWVHRKLSGRPPIVRTVPGDAILPGKVSFNSRKLGSDIELGYVLQIQNNSKKTVHLAVESFKARIGKTEYSDLAGVLCPSSVSSGEQQSIHLPVFPVVYEDRGMEGTLEIEIAFGAKESALNHLVASEYQVLLDGLKASQLTDGAGTVHHSIQQARTKLLYGKSYMSKKTLKKAIEEDDLESFIKEHEDDPEGDLDKVEEVIRSSETAPETSTKED